MLSGFEKTLTDNIVGYTAHAEITSYGNRPLPDYPGSIRYLQRKVPEIRALAPYVEQECVLRTPSGISGIVLQGVLPGDSLTLALKRVIKGSAPASQTTDSLPGLIISKGVAKDLHTEVGKSVIAFRFHEGMRSREDILSHLKKFRVVGIFETGMTEYDNGLAYTTLDAAQNFAGYSPTQVSGFRVMGRDLDQARLLSKDISKVIRYPYYAQSVYDIYPTIFGWIELQKKPIPIILGLIIIVAAFNIISTLLIMVIEKTKTIGVLKSLGAQDSGIAKIFLTEGMVITLSGVLIGNVIGFAVSWLQLHFHFFKLRSDIYFMSSVPISIEWEHYVIVSLIAIVISLFATLIPARIASRVRPLTALKFG
ncbi:MAG: FtsX-like permease family protein [Bacteroidota bacterium]|nr:FtsX-like permease family protein [Bacteroidota bacterium]